MVTRPIARMTPGSTLAAFAFMSILVCNTSIELILTAPIAISCLYSIKIAAAHVTTAVNISAAHGVPNNSHRRPHSAERCAFNLAAIATLNRILNFLAQTSGVIRLGIILDDMVSLLPPVYAPVLKDTFFEQLIDTIVPTVEHPTVLSRILVIGLTDIDPAEECPTHTLGVTGNIQLIADKIRLILYNANLGDSRSSTAEAARNTPANFQSLRHILLRNTNLRGCYTCTRITIIPIHRVPLSILNTIRSRRNRRNRRRRRNICCKCPLDIQHMLMSLTRSCICLFQLISLQLFTRKSRTACC